MAVGYILDVGSKTFDGVWFASYSLDHPPPHVHGEYGDTLVIVDVFPDGTVAESARRDAVRPPGAKRNDVRRILTVAAANGLALWQLWEKKHGTAS